jgi:hypothetical protein
LSPFMKIDQKEDGGEVRKNERCVLEDFKPCSQSHLWKLMMSFYHRKGPESWSQGIVPHFITCNTFIGKSYANVRTQSQIISMFFEYCSTTRSTLFLFRFCTDSSVIVCIRMRRLN